jgi:hypothetical protein
MKPGNHCSCIHARLRLASTIPAALVLATLATAQKRQWFVPGGEVAVVGDQDQGGKQDVLASDPATGIVRLLSTETGAVLATLTGSGSFGRALTVLGNLNSDPRPEFAIGAPLQGTGAVHVFTFTGVAALVQIVSAPAGASSFGASLALLDDLNGGGPELAVGAPADTASSRVFVYNGNPVTLLYGFQPAGINDFGRRVARIGGNRMAIGAPAYDRPQTPGPAEGYAAAYSLTAVSATQIWGFAYGFANERFGESVGAAGDVDGDGNPDVAIGHPGVSTYWAWSGTPTGNYLSFYQVPNIGQRTVACGDIDGDGKTELAATDGTNLHILKPRTQQQLMTPLLVRNGSSNPFAGGIASADVFAIASTSLVAGRTGVVEIENLSASTRFGLGCSTSAPAPQLDALSRPTVGTNYVLQLGHSYSNPGTHAVAVFVAAAPPVQIPVGACTSFVNLNAILLHAATAQQTLYPVSVPNDPALIYGGVVMQAFVATPAGALDATNAQVGQIGAF